VEMTSSDVWVMAHAAQISLALALCSITSGTILAVLLTPLAFARFALARFAYRLYVFVVRGTPVLLLALLTFYALASYWGRISPYAAGVVVLTIYLSALFAEVFRGGVLAIPNPLWDSSKSLGLSRRSILWRVVTPLVARYSLPPYLNVCVMAVKASSVLSIISVWELTFASREIIERTLDVYRVLAVASVFYFIMCFAIDRAGRWMEGRLAAKGFAGEPA
jgi:His/Glu/Gln/Arg/opine family amino acid ABC transporter permease subunit